jgi:hypothetical protein
MTYVAKITLPGYDVDTASPEQCAVHSGFPPLKAKLDQSDPHIATLAVDFTARVAQGVNHTVFSIPHKYVGYIPFVLANIVFDTGSQIISGTNYAGVGANLSIKAYCDATNFYVVVYDNASWTSTAAWLYVSYFIFAENGT